MPSPLGHGLAGAIVGLTAEQLARNRGALRAVSGKVVVACVAFALLPDADLLVFPVHRAATHSFAAALIVTILTAGVTRWVTGRINWAVAFACGTAWASHLLLDWLGEDFNIPRGIQAFWPVSDRWVVSGWDLFRGTERDDLFTPKILRHNAITAIQEIATLGPIFGAMWWLRVRNIRRSRVRSSGQDGRRPPSP